MRPACKDHLIKLVCLRLNSLHDRRVAVAVGDHPPARNRIDDPPPIAGVKTRALSPINHRNRLPQAVLSEGMPDGIVTARHIKFLPEKDHGWQNR